MTQHTFDIIGVGSPIIDSLALVSEEFIAGIAGAKGGMELVGPETIAELISGMDESPVEVPGGSSANAIFTLAKLGVSATFLGKVGNDARAEFYQKAFANLGGDTRRFKKGSIPNGHCLSLVTPDSERTMRTDLGAAMTLDPSEVSPEDFAGCRHAHIEGFLLFNRDLMYQVLDSAKAAGCTISLDLASFEVVNATKDILPEILTKYIDLVFSNEEEANTLMGLGEDYTAMAKQLAGYCDVGVVKLGKDGSLIAQGDMVAQIDPVFVERAVDTTAAGDLWAAGFLYGWLNGKDVQESGSFGSLLGAEAVKVMGYVLSEETWEQVFAFTKSVKAV